MDVRDLPPIEPGDDLDRAIRRAAAERRSDRYYLVGMLFGACVAVGGALSAVSGGPAWTLVGGLAAGVAIGIGFSVLARKQLDYDPSGEIAPPPPGGRVPDTSPQDPPPASR